MGRPCPRNSKQSRKVTRNRLMVRLSCTGGVAKISVLGGLDSAVVNYCCCAKRLPILYSCPSDQINATSMFVMQATAATTNTTTATTTKAATAAAAASKGHGKESVVPEDVTSSSSVPSSSPSPTDTTTTTTTATPTPTPTTTPIILPGEMQGYRHWTYTNESAISLDLHDGPSIMMCLRLSDLDNTNDEEEERDPDVGLSKMTTKKTNNTGTLLSLSELLVPHVVTEKPLIRFNH